MSFRIPNSSQVVLYTTHNSRFEHPAFFSIICHALHRTHNKQDYYNLVNQLPISYPYQTKNYNPHHLHLYSCPHNPNLHTAPTRAKPLMNLLTRLLTSLTMNLPRK